MVKGWHHEPARHSLAARGLRTKRVPYKSSAGKRTTLKWNPSDKRTINVTYDLITPESASRGDIEDEGFEKKDIQIESIDDILSVFYEYGRMEGDGYSFYSCDGDKNYYDGSEKRYGIHFSRTFTPEEINKIYNKLAKEKLVYDAYRFPFKKR